MEEDRMSQLPNDILLLILDKMDIFEAVETMILSHRWINVWRSLPCLRFPLSFAAATRFRHKFESYFAPLRSEFVSQLLSHRDATATIHDFHLSLHHNGMYPYTVDREFLEECVLYAINHGVQSLRLHAPTKLTLRLPEALISCKTLRELDLRNKQIPIKVPERLSLPNLKTLLLKTSSLVFDDDDVRMEPFSGLPELEKLTLNFTYTSFDWIVFKTPKLRVLEITNVHLVKEIYAPLLTSFGYDCYRAWECAKVDLPMLEQVHLDIDEVEYRFNKIHNNFVRMLHQFGNATTVSLTLDTLKVLERNGGPFDQTLPPPFPNMKFLKVIGGVIGKFPITRTHTVFQGIIDYLTRTLCCEVEFSPNVFVLEQIPDSDEDDSDSDDGRYDFDI